MDCFGRYVQILKKDGNKIKVKTEEYANESYTAVERNTFNFFALGSLEIIIYLLKSTFFILKIIDKTS